MYVMRPDNVRGYVKEQGQCSFVAQDLGCQCDVICQQGIECDQYGFAINPFMLSSHHLSS